MKIKKRWIKLQLLWNSAICLFLFMFTVWSTARQICWQCLWIVPRWYWIVRGSLVQIWRGCRRIVRGWCWVFRGWLAQIWRRCWCIVRGCWRIWRGCWRMWRRCWRIWRRLRCIWRWSIAGTAGRRKARHGTCWRVYWAERWWTE